MLEKTTRNSSKFYVYLQRVRGNSGRNVNDRVIRCTVPYGKDTIPLFVLFRALGFVADKEILQHIVYDFTDAEMLDMIRPSIEEAVSCNSEEGAQDWIGRRLATPFTVKAKRVQYARDVLQKELLPHVGIGEMTETQKAFFVGYMVHRMLLVALGRQPQTDRDNYSVKRLRMAGGLMADLFRCARLQLMRVRALLAPGSDTSSLGLGTGAAARLLRRRPDCRTQSVDHANVAVWQAQLVLACAGSGGRV